MSTRENIRLIARAPFTYKGVISWTCTKSPAENIDSYRQINAS